MAEMMLTTIDSGVVFIIVVVVFVTVASLFIEGNALMLVLVPILAPIASSYGIDDVHFAMVYIATASIGALTPPVGTLMFVTCSITGCKTKDFMKEAIPFYVLLFGMLIFTILVPQSVLWLRDLVY
jgi:TRAP-type C4-dicarboxylate transport system permease large subunit